MIINQSINQPSSNFIVASIYHLSQFTIEVGCGNQSMPSHWTVPGRYCKITFNAIHLLVIYMPRILYGACNNAHFSIIFVLQCLVYFVIREQKYVA